MWLGRRGITLSSLKVFYVAGPGDVASTYTFWRNGEQDPSESNMTYSGQFFSTISRLGYQGHIISTHKTKQYIDDEDFIIEHRPNPGNSASGLGFHWGQIQYGLGLLKTAVTSKADYVVISSGTHWFMLWPLRLWGIKVIPTIHCVIWPKYGKRKLLTKAIDLFNGLFLKWGTDNIIVVSQEIAKQLKQLGVSEHKIHQFSPYYPKDWFDVISPPVHERRPFKLLYIGRMEKVKGIFDLLSAFRSLKSSGLQVELDYCGNGSAYSSMLELVEGEDGVRCHGHCNREKIFSLMNDTHAVVVPTTTEFVEGFNKVVIESVLAGRPVVTSDVCPAIEDVLSAAAQCEPDNVNSYVENISRLYEDKQYYEVKQSACLTLQDKFYDQKHSWGNLLSSLLEQKNEK